MRSPSGDHVGRQIWRYGPCHCQSVLIEAVVSAAGVWGEMAAVNLTSRE